MKKNLRKDLLVISDFIDRNEKILDVGCGDGKLLSFLMKEKKLNAEELN